MVRKSIITSTTIIFLSVLIYLLSNKDSRGDVVYRDKLQHTDRLLVAIDNNIPGNFEINGVSYYGLQHEILNSYASLLGIELEIIPDNSTSAYEALLKEKKINIAAVLKSNILDESTYAIPVFNTSYVVLTRKEKKSTPLSNIFELIEKADGKTIMVSQAFSSSKSFDILLDSLKNTHTYLTTKNILNMLQDLSMGKYDYLICEKNEADIGQALIKNLTGIYEFREEIPVYVMFNKEDSIVAKHFESWLDVFKASDKYAKLDRIYSHPEQRSQIVRNNGRRISEYDEIIKKIAKEENLDWRLISAMAYQESKFNPSVISSKGACGLMQVMPQVARQFDYDPDNLMDVETNITVAVKLIKNIERSIKFAPGTHINDRMSIMLACYNCGIGHVLDARKLAVKYGENPDEWLCVKKYLELKSNDDIIAEEIVKSGRFYGYKETSAFVSKVIDKYQSYCQIASL